MHTEILTAPEYHPVSLAQAKQHLRVTHAAEDALLSEIILPAAHREAVQRLGRTIMPTQLKATLDAFPFCKRLIQLLYPKLQAVDSVEYRDADSNTQTLSTALYGVDTAQARLFLKNGAAWPTTDGLSGAVAITYKAGYSLATATEQEQREAVPATVRQWLLIRIGTLYEHREELVTGTIVSEIPFVDGLLDLEREWSI